MESLKGRLSEILQRARGATPGPWRWMEDLFREKYMRPVKDKPGHYRARPDRKASDSWVYFLAGPVNGPRSGRSDDDFRKGLIGEWDFHRVMCLQWSDVRGNELWNRSPNPEDADFIAHARTDVPWLLMAVKCLLQPEFRDLLHRIEQIKDDLESESFCANAVWYGYGGYPGFKKEFCKLIGPESTLDDPTGMLHSSEAYDVGYEILYSHLPDCRNCGC